MQENGKIQSENEQSDDETGLISPKYFRAERTHRPRLNRAVSNGSGSAANLTGRGPSGQNEALSASLLQKTRRARSKAGRFICRNLDAKVTFLEWLATEPSKRRLKTRQELSRQLGVGRRTLFRWEHEPEQLILELMKADFIKRFERAMDSLANRAITGNVKAAELYLKICGFEELRNK